MTCIANIETNMLLPEYINLDKNFYIINQMSTVQLEALVLLYNKEIYFIMPIVIEFYAIVI